MSEPKPDPIPEIVVSSIRKSFPNQAEEILTQLKWDGINGNFYFNRWGMYVGVETDGHIHT